MKLTMTHRPARVARERITEIGREHAEGREPHLRHGRGVMVLFVLAGLQTTKEEGVSA
jgi:hypothetical protein